MDEDDFGELYGDPTPGISSIGAASSHSVYPFYDDDIDEDKGFAAASLPLPVPSKPQVLLQIPETHVLPKVPEARSYSDRFADRDSDEDDDMLLLGYSSKSGADNKLQVPTSALPNHKQVMDVNNPKQDFLKFGELSRENEVVSLSPNSIKNEPMHAPSVALNQDIDSADVNPVDANSEVNNYMNHTITIPGLSTTVNAPFFDMGETDEDAWERRQEGAKLTDRDAAAEVADDWDSESEDDLRIVLNTEYPYYAAGDKGAVGRYEGGSEDEDEEDLIIFAGGEPKEEGEDMLQPPDAQALQVDGSIHPAGDKQTSVEDGKGHEEKMIAGVSVPNQVVLRGYGYHNSYNSPYKYVRAGAAGTYGTSAPAGQTLGSRVGPLKGVNGRGDWRGVGRGSFGTMSQYPAWSNYEYTLPPSMTVFDIDLEAFEEKPWRQPSFDVTDFFNFGFDEITWKEYCKQLAQIRLESTMQSKIRVYESSRSEQDYDPDLPAELAVAAGLHEAGDRGQQRLNESEATATGMGRRGYTPMIPLGRPIEVEGGLGDRRPSADSRKQRPRDCDSILLLDAIEEDMEVQRLRDENREAVDGDAGKEGMDEEQLHEEQEEEEDEMDEDTRSIAKSRQDQHGWHKERMHASRIYSLQGPNTLDGMETFHKVREGRSKIGLDPMAVSMDRNMQLPPQAGKPAIATDSGKISGDPPDAHRELFPRTRTASKPLAEERRDLDQPQRQSDFLCDNDESKPKSSIDEGESLIKNLTNKEDVLESNKGDYARDNVSTENNDGRSTSQRGEDFKANVSQEVQIKDKSPKEIQVESSGGSSKRQRLVSPEGSHTASWDNYDVQRSIKSGVHRKESRDSGESALEGPEDISTYRKKSKSYPDTSRRDLYKDSRQESESYRKKQGSTFTVHELENEIDAHADSVQEIRKRPKHGSVEKGSLEEFSRHWKEKDYGKGRGEELDRREYLAKEEALHVKEKVNIPESRKKDEEDRQVTYYRERGGNRSESRRKEEVDRRERDVRRRDGDDKRDRFSQHRESRESQHRESRESQRREKDVEVLNWHTSERRKKEDDYRRKDRADEDSDYIRKEREKHGSERHDRDAEQHLRTKDQESGKREKVDDHHRSKPRDGSTRESEDSRSRNVDFQDSHGRAHKDEERSGRSRRGHEEDRFWRGRDDSRLSDSTRSAEPRSHSKAKRKDMDDHGKGKNRTHEGRARSTYDREGLSLVDSHERDSGKHDRVSDDQKSYEKRLHSDKHRSDGKRSKDLDKELNGPPSEMGDYASASRKKKAVSDKTETANKKKMEEPSITRTKEGQSSTRARLEDEFNSGKVSSNSRHLEKGASEDERQKGRSKLERWRSHKDIEMDASERPFSHILAKKDEKLRQSSISREKQHHDYLELEKRQVARIEVSLNVSSPGEQVNGEISKLDGKGDDRVRNKEGEIEPVGRNHAEPLEQLQQEPQTNMAVKLEKRKERFKVSVEDKDSLRKLDYEDNHLVDKDDSRQERPPRKRRWASG